MGDQNQINMDEKVNTSVDQLNQWSDAMDVKEDANKLMDKRQSFERFGDDLTEVIVSYLSTEDKFRFECLSKRIQSLMFTKQDTFAILFHADEDDISTALYFKRNDYFYLKLANVEKCLAKLKNLKTLDIDCNYSVDSQLLKLIADNCNHLKLLTIPWDNDISHSTVEYLGERCGPKLEYLAIDNSNISAYNAKLGIKLYSEEIRHLLSYTLELTSLKLNSFDWRLFKKKSAFELKPVILLPKLEKFKCFEYNAKDMIKFLDQYCQQLKHFSSNLCEIIDLKEAELLISAFGRCRRLRSLKLLIEFIGHKITDDQVYETYEKLAEIADNCKELRKFVIYFEQISGNQNYLTHLKTFTQLTELKVKLDYKNSDEICVSFADWKHLTQLKVLTIDCNHLVDTDFANIGQILPQLESITTSTEDVMYNKLLEYISQLKRLQFVAIYNANDKDEPTISHSDIKHFFESCPQITSFSFDDFQSNGRKLNISPEFIDELKQLAKRMPKTDIKIDFMGINVDTYRHQLIDLPLNLHIDVNESD